MKFSKNLLLNLIRESFHRGKVTKYFTSDEDFHQWRFPDKVRHEIVKAQEFMNLYKWTSSAIPFISLFCHHQTHTVIFIFFSCTMHYPFQRAFSHCTFYVSLFLFHRSQLTASAFNRMIHLCFRKKSLIGQLNVQDKLRQLKRKINIPWVT